MPWNTHKNWGAVKRNRSKTYRVNGKLTVPPPALNNPRPTSGSADPLTDFFMQASQEYEPDSPAFGAIKAKPKYGERKKARNSEWHKNLGPLLNALRRYMYKGPSKCSVDDCEKMANAWCVNCSDLGPMCTECAKRTHVTSEARTHICRTIKTEGTSYIWEVAKVSPWGNKISIKCSEHTCIGKQNVRSISLIQLEGQCKVVIDYCSCRQWNDVILSVGFWPSSPSSCQR
jgi:hypothetical protein